MTSRTPSFFHSKRFRKGQISQAVTGVYRINLRTGLLTCAGVVYKKIWPNDNWDRRLHTEKAMERFNSSPLKIQFTTPLHWPEKSKAHQEEIYRRYRVLESFIREVFCNYGVKSTPHNDYAMQDPVFLKRLAEIQKEIFGPVPIPKGKTTVSLKRRRVEHDEKEHDNQEEDNVEVLYNRRVTVGGGIGDYYEIGWDPCSDSITESFKFFALFCLVGLYLAYLNNILTEQMIANALSFCIHDVMMPVAHLIRRMIDTQTGRPYDDSDSFSMDDD